MNIKLKSLLEENSHIDEIFLWMDYTGKWIRVPREGHAPWAANYIAYTLKKPVGNDVYGKMYDLGWIRISIFGFMGVNAVHFNLRREKHPSSAQTDSMIELAKKYDATEIIDDSNGRVTDIY